MSSEHFTVNEKEDYVDTEERSSFTTSAPFHALVEHFESILNSIKEKEGLEWIWAAFDGLLANFKAYYSEIKKKTYKILEFKAKSAVEMQKAELLTIKHQEVERDLRNAIQRLQDDLQVTDEERRRLLEENELLKREVRKEDKENQVNFAFRDVSIGQYDDASFTEDSKEAKRFKHKLPKNFVVKGGKDKTNIKALKNDLNILLAGLKITKRNETALKTELQSKDVLIKEHSHDISERDAMFDRNLSQMSEIKKQLETSLKECKAELFREKKKYQKMCKELQEALQVNTKQSADVKSKEHEMNDLKTKLEKLASEKGFAARKADVFERHLAQSHVDIEKLQEEIQILNEKTEKPENETPVLGTIPDASEEYKMEISAQERLIENLKTQVTVRDRKFQQVREELNSNIEVLLSLKEDFSNLNKRKSSLESEVRDVKTKLKERNGEVKELKDKLKEYAKEMEETKNKFNSWITKYNQIVVKKEKFHNLYNHLKTMNNQQKKENQFLQKRQQYLVKILKDKDKEIETLVSWKRFVQKID